MCISLFYSNGELKIVDYLVKETSANIYCKDKRGRTPLDRARAQVYTQKILCMHYCATNSNNHTVMK